MSGNESSLPAVTGADDIPGPGGLGQPPLTVEDATLREQVLESINDVLCDPDPEGEWARSQLRQHLASYPGEPERAFLEHLMCTRKLAAPHHPLPAPALPAPNPSAASLHPPVSPDESIRKRIRTVLGDRMLLTAFQPVRELPDERITGFEALTRFVSGDGANADSWFREAAAVGLGPDLEIAALRCALMAAREIPSHFFVAFNLSPATFTDHRVQDLLQGCNRAMDKIVVELTGRAADEQWHALIRALKPLRERGLRVAVDGSGPDFTPAGRILSLRPDIIKLDRTFIEGIRDRDDYDDPAVMGLAKEVGAVLAAEGIETEAELAAVIGTGMSAGQGYLLGRPTVHPLQWSSWVVQVEPASSGP